MCYVLLTSLDCCNINYPSNFILDFLCNFLLYNVTFPMSYFCRMKVFSYDFFLYSVKVFHYNLFLYYDSDSLKLYSEQSVLSYGPFLYDVITFIYDLFPNSMKCFPIIYFCTVLQGFSTDYFCTT